MCVQFIMQEEDTLEAYYCLLSFVSESITYKIAHRHLYKGILTMLGVRWSRALLVLPFIASLLFISHK